MVATTNGRWSLVASQASSVSERSGMTTEEEDKTLARDIPDDGDGSQSYLKAVVVVLPRLVTNERDGALKVESASQVGLESFKRGKGGGCFSYRHGSWPLGREMVAASSRPGGSTESCPQAVFLTGALGRESRGDILATELRGHKRRDIKRGDLLPFDSEKRACSRQATLIP
ncbi:hypothetical protein GW17_00034188 [Ensete ventricosum]|nr:hypothetical protein GW17_00034188 [Ensete ventricosum]